MTNAEAIRRLRDHFAIHDDGRPTPYLDGAERMAIEALERQIPKKPKEETINHGIDIFGEYDIETNCMCANCGTVVGDYEKNEMYFEFCPDCGQRIDWSDER